MVSYIEIAGRRGVGDDNGGSDDSDGGGGVDCR